jgi:hypothetical protein
VLAAGLILAFGLLAGRPSAPPPQTMPPGPGPGYLTTVAELRERARQAARGNEPARAAVADLEARLPALRARAPRPSEVIDIAGTEDPFVDDAAAAYGLALGWGIAGDRRDAVAAAAYVTAWSRTARRIDNACPTGGECQTSLVVSRAAPAFVFAADLVADAGVLDAADLDVFRAWLREVVLPAASRRANNWGDAGTLMRFVVADYLGDDEEAVAALADWRRAIDLVAADGSIPEEVRRGRAAMTYTQEALEYKVAVAVIADRRGVDLWEYRGPAGAGLREALDLLAAYWDRPREWPGGRASAPRTGPVWELAYGHWRTAAWVPIVVARRPFGDLGNSAIRWTTLTAGVPLSGE